MKACTLVIFTASTLLASDPRLLDLSLKAERDFERVASVYRPAIADAGVCVQSQAAALAVGPTEDRSLLYYRKGHCAFAEAVATGETAQFLAAAGDFDKAIEAWPTRIRKPSKTAPPEPAPPALRVFASISRLRAAASPEAIAAARPELTAAVASPNCSSNLISVPLCTALLATGSQWLGWIALRNSELDEAARRFAATPTSGWPEWTQGRREFAAAHFPAAAAQYAAAIQRWKLIWEGDGANFALALGPRPQFAAALADWGGARMLAGDLTGAIATLDASVRADSTNANALFLRARAKDLSGLTEAALTDYNLASRHAFAAAQDLASGEAHLYRGILLFRRQDFARAEEEFSSALNFEMAGALRPDARAWRHLAAVAGGSCGAARQSLSESLPAVSPFFPRDEARTLASACGGI